MPPEKKITDLPALIEALPPEDRAIAGRIFDASATTGRLDPPREMRPWIENSFGSVEAVREQRVVKITNRVTLEGALFNELRASRLLDTGTDLDLEREIEATRSADPKRAPPPTSSAASGANTPPPPPTSPSTTVSTAS